MTGEVEELPQPDGAADSERNAALAAIRESDSTAHWQVAAEPLEYETVKWKPDLVGASNRVLHLSMGGDLTGAIRRRMREAYAASAKVAFATASTGLEVVTLSSLQGVDARFVMVEERTSGLKVSNHRSVADWIAQQQISLSPDDMVTLVRQRLDAADGAGHNVDRGRWFEEALCILFSQVSWLRVDEHAYRNETEEIDLTMTAKTAGYLASLAGGPIVLATAKNEATATGSDVVKYLKQQMANRKDRCKLGFLCSAHTISPDAYREILRAHSGAADLVIVPTNRETINVLLTQADDLDEEIEKLIVKAIND